MFKLTQRYLYKHYDAESGERTGNAILLQICMRYQRARWWWKWRKEQPGVNSMAYTLRQMVRAVFGKTTF